MTIRGKQKLPSDQPTPVDASRPWREIRHYAIIALVALSVCLFIVWVFVLKAETLVTFGLTGYLFYVLLVVLGLAAAVVLFGVLRSTALYKGKILGGDLELGGPAVVFLLVVFGFYKLVPSPTPMRLTAYVHGPNGKHDIVLRNSGQVILDLGSDRRREKIGDKGEAYFSIPPEFRGQRVPISVEADGYEIAAPNAPFKLDSDRLYLQVRPKPGRIAGRVQHMRGNPVPGASVRLDGLSVSSGPDGHFEVAIPGERMKAGLLLTATALGYVPQSLTAVPNSNEITVELRRK